MSCRGFLRGGIIEMAGHGLRAVLDRLGPFDPAAVEHKPAAWVERAARRDRRKPRHRTGDLDQALGVAGKRRDRAHQALGVGVQRGLHDILHPADFGDAAGMQTSASRSMARLRAPDSERLRWVRMVSTSWSPIRYSGLRLVSGS